MALEKKRGGGPCSRPLARRMLFAMMIVVLGAVVGGSPLPHLPGYEGDDDPKVHYPLPHHHHPPPPPVTDAAANRLTRRFESADTGDGAYLNLARRAETHAGGRDAMKVHYKRPLRDALDAGSPDLRRRRELQPPQTNPLPGSSPGWPGQPPLLRRDAKHADVSARHRKEESEHGGGQIYRRSGPPGGGVQEYMDFPDQRHRAHEKGAPRSGSLTRRDVPAMDRLEENAFLVRPNQNDNNDQPCPRWGCPGGPQNGGGKSAHNHVHRRQEDPNYNAYIPQAFGKLVRREWLGQDPGSSGSSGGAQGPGGPPDGQEPRHGKRSNLFRRDRDHKPDPNDWTPPVPVDPRSQVYHQPPVRRKVVVDTTSGEPALDPPDMINEGGRRQELYKRVPVTVNGHDDLRSNPDVPGYHPRLGHAPAAQQEPLHRRDMIDQEMGREAMHKREHITFGNIGKLLPPDPRYDPRAPRARSEFQSDEILHKRKVPSGPRDEGGEFIDPPASLEARSERYAASKYNRRDVLNESEVLLNKRQNPPPRNPPHGVFSRPPASDSGVDGLGSDIKLPAEPERGEMAKDWQWNLSVQF
ncbi:uncharacterized protein UTRI_05760 [Ustilago trichophora]|uniref:Uncharacterized protein n=1 Tax=Ustilago trichophora TaxID=86804 RepID=A0A5C3EKU4_9BASI|nr:uncharacterized protein UTRI_05760 [Ustilago trichophora]